MILPIYTFGKPVLRQIAQDIDIASYPDLQKLIADMYETLKKSEGVGLAAPQIGLAIRLVVVDLDCISDDEPQYKGFLKTYINGHIIETSQETDSMEEGCLSIPAIHESVTRASKIRIQYQDEQGAEHDEWIDGFLARVIQHEFDHLEGKMFVDRVSSLRKQLIKKKLIAISKGIYRCAYKTKR